MIHLVKQAMNADEVTATDIIGGWRFEVTRGQCRAKFDLYSDHVNWVSLESPGDQDWASDAHKMVRAVLFSAHVEYVIASERFDTGSGEMLRHFAPWKPSIYRGKPCLRWDRA